MSRSLLLRPESDKSEARLSLLAMGVGGAVVHLLAILLFAGIWSALKLDISPTAPIAWATFALHPLLMTLAFGLLGPIAITSWRLYSSLGMPRPWVKRCHTALTTLAVLCGWLGVADMWIVHSRGAAAQRAKGWAVHFQSLHSWVGFAAILAFTFQWAGGLSLFVNPAAPAELKRRLMPAHALVGSVALFGTLGSVATGCLSLVYRGDNVQRKGVLFNTAGLIVFFLSAALGVVLAAGSRAKRRPDAVQGIAPDEGEAREPCGIAAGGGEGGAAQ